MYEEMFRLQYFPNAHVDMVRESLRLRDNTLEEWKNRVLGERPRALYSLARKDATSGIVVETFVMVPEGDAEVADDLTFPQLMSMWPWVRLRWGVSPSGRPQTPSFDR